MDGTHAIRRRVVAWIAVAACLSGCGQPVPVEQLPSPAAVLASAGKRLSDTLSAEALTGLATDGDRFALAASLTAAERDALSTWRPPVRRQSVRPKSLSQRLGDSVPFWLADEGFKSVGWTLRVAGSDWVVGRKTFAAGSVGLGVNGLDRSSSAHYAVFLRAVDRSTLVPPELREGWHAMPAAVAVSMVSGVSLPIEALPPALGGAVLLQPRHDLRHGTMLAQGRRVWKTHVPTTRRPDQLTVEAWRGPDA